MEREDEYQKFIKRSGINLRIARLAQNLDLKTVATATGLSSKKIELIEYGQYEWSIGDVVKLCAYYKISFWTIGNK